MRAILGPAGYLIDGYLVIERDDVGDVNASCEIFRSGVNSSDIQTGTAETVGPPRTVAGNGLQPAHQRSADAFKPPVRADGVEMRVVCGQTQITLLVAERQSERGTHRPAGSRAANAAEILPAMFQFSHMFRHMKRATVSGQRRKQKDFELGQDLFTEDACLPAALCSYPYEGIDAGFMLGHVVQVFEVTTSPTSSRRCCCPVRGPGRRQDSVSTSKFNVTKARSGEWISHGQACFRSRGCRHGEEPDRSGDGLVNRIRTLPDSPGKIALVVGPDRPAITGWCFTGRSSASASGQAVASAKFEEQEEATVPGKNASKGGGKPGNGGKPWAAVPTSPESPAR